MREGVTTHQAAAAGPHVGHEPDTEGGGDDEEDEPDGLRGGVTPHGEAAGYQAHEDGAQWKHDDEGRGSYDAVRDAVAHRRLDVEGRKGPESAGGSGAGVRAQGAGVPAAIGAVRTAPAASPARAVAGTRSARAAMVAAGVSVAPPGACERCWMHVPVLAGRL